jgi:hypothetical protein
MLDTMNSGLQIAPILCFTNIGFHLILFCALTASASFDNHVHIRVKQGILFCTFDLNFKT